MKSTIINLGDYRMDDEDRRLRELFGHAPVPDNGFSAQVLRRIKRGEILRRLMLPMALLAGGVFAVRPVLEMLDAWSLQLRGLGTNLTEAGSLISGLTGTMTLALPLLVVAALALRWLED